MRHVESSWIKAWSLKHSSVANLSRTLREIQLKELLDRLRWMARSQQLVAFREEVAIVLNHIDSYGCSHL